MREPPGFVWVWSLYTIPLGSLFAFPFLLPMYCTHTILLLIADLLQVSRFGLFPGLSEAEQAAAALRVRWRETFASEPVRALTFDSD